MIGLFGLNLNEAREAAVDAVGSRDLFLPVAHVDFKHLVGVEPLLEQNTKLKITAFGG